jgi:hypothetical protein
VNHLRVAYFDNQDIQNWSLEHPYKSPFGEITLALPQPSPTPRHAAVSWSERGVQTREFPWVELDSSLQWRAFRRTTEFVRRKGGRPFVIVGPLNEHMLAASSRKRYGELKQETIARMQEAEIPCYAPPLLPSDLYGDASHPLAAGYARLAEQLHADESFQRWLGER